MNNIYYQLKANITPKDYVIFDLETTGLNSSYDKVIEIGAIKYQNYQEVDRFSYLINPQCEISSFITSLTGISNLDVKDCPTIHEVLHKFKTFVDDSVLLAYNASFDIGFIASECERCGMEMLNNPVVDVLPLARRSFRLPNYKLETLKKYLHLEHIISHRSVSDCMVTNEVYLKCIEGKED